MSRTIRLLLLLAVSVALFAQASVASAAPVDWKFIDVTVHPDQQQSLFLVSGELAPTAKLPYKAEIAVPAGLQVQWVGEILGDDPSKDPELKYEKTTAKGVDIYSFTLTRGRVAQVEGTLPSATTFDGTNYASTLKWTAWQDVPEVRISQRVPQSSTIVKAAAGASLAPGGDTGYSYYTKTVGPVKAGEVVDLSFSYALPAAGTTGAAGSSNNTLAIGIILFVVLGAIVLLVLGVQKKSAARAALREPEDEPGNARVAKQAADSDFEAFSDEEPQEAPEPRREVKRPVVEPEPQAPKRKNLTLPILIVVGVFLVGFAIAGAQSTSANVVDGKISRDFGSTSPCQNASVPFTVNPGVDLAADGDKLLEGFEGMEGVGVITIDITQSKVDMAWCVSSQTEETMRQVLNSSGMITLGQSASTAPAATATPTAEATAQ